MLTPNPGDVSSALNALCQHVPHHAQAWLAGLVTSFAVALLLVLTKRWHGAFTHDMATGVQKFHLFPTPRIGGVPLLLGLWALWAASDGAVFTLDFAPLHMGGAASLEQHDAQAALILKSIALACLPAWLAGMGEDITKRVSVGVRLVATMVSGLLAWWLTGFALSRLDVPGVDVLLLQWLPVSVAFTAFALAGVANALNIIDGFHGLAPFTSLWALLGFALLGQAVGDTPLALACLGMAAVVLGFAGVNWPWGRMFMGDGGAYMMGFALGWLAVLLVQRNPDVSPFAALLLCLHPVNETLFSVLRRRARGALPGQPDRQHFHSLLKRRYVVRWLPDNPTWLRNAVTGLLVSAMTLPALPLALLTRHSSLAAVLACLALAMVYLTLYARMVRHRWVLPLCLLRRNNSDQVRLRRLRMRYAATKPG